MISYSQRYSLKENKELISNKNCVVWGKNKKFIIYFCVACRGCPLAFFFLWADSWGSSGERRTRRKVRRLALRKFVFVVIFICKTFSLLIDWFKWIWESTIRDLKWFEIKNWLNKFYASESVFVFKAAKCLSFPNTTRKQEFAWVY